MGYTQLSRENGRKIGAVKNNYFPDSFIKYYTCSKEQ